MAATREPDHDPLAILTGKERLILTRRFGFDGGHARSLEEIGVELGVSRERIRQIEARALRGLRHPRTRVPVGDAQS